MSRLLRRAVFGAFALGIAAPGASAHVGAAVDSAADASRALGERTLPALHDIAGDLLAPAGADLSAPSAAPGGFTPPGGVWSIEVPNISYSHDGAPTPVPLPAALPVFLVALGALALRARRWIVA